MVSHVVYSLLSTFRKTRKGIIWKLLMNPRDTWLLCDDTALLRDCSIEAHRTSGPGGQHRNKVSTAIRLRHKASGIVGQSDRTRSHHQNRKSALANLRMHIACGRREACDPAEPDIPPEIAGCFTAAGGKSTPPRRLKLTPGSRLFWPTAAVVLDVLAAADGQLSTAAAALGISTGNLSAFLRSQGNLLAATQAIRASCGQKPLR